MINWLRRFWIPGLTLLVVLVVGAFGYSRLKRIVAERLSQELTVILDVTVGSVRLWASQQQDLAGTVAADTDLQQAVARLQMGSVSFLSDTGSPDNHVIEDILAPVMQRLDYDGWLIADASGQLLAASRGDADPATVAAHPGISAVIEQGVSTLSPPMVADSVHPTILLATPLLTRRDSVLAVLALTIRPELEFTSLLRSGRLGESGETYAFDAGGRMVTRSRFEDQLRAIGLLPVDDTTASSILRVQLRDPGGNLLFGHRPVAERDALPYTLMATSAIAGESGVNVDGYRDYRGVRVVGAWTWVPEIGIGIATEIDRAEALRGLIAVENGFWGLALLLLAVVVGLFLYSRTVARLRHRVKRAERIGQYQLDKKIGEGGMGRVYLGRHSLLRRPTAVKLIRSDEVSELLVQRFEREVQYTSRLNHPNTIAIYDYGRTPNRVFYYAMEYVEGITMDQLVAEVGPVPDGRVVYLLSQVCGSLAEAHALQIVHRDIKPANVMLGIRGGVPDFVKVLDFGLVRDIEQPEDEALTQAGAVTGTPMYMPPEAIAAAGSADARGDVYAVGAVAYFLITGTPPFSGRNVVEICAKHLHAEPESLSSRLGRDVAPDLEKLVLACLAKDPADRPDDAAQLLDELRRCSVSTSWSHEPALRWWRQRTARPKDEEEDSVRPPTTEVESHGSDSPSYFNVDISGRRSAESG